MIELRYVVWENIGHRQLEYRILQGYMDASGALNVAGAEWGPWKLVPEVDGTNPAVTPPQQEKPE